VETKQANLDDEPDPRTDSAIVGVHPDDADSGTRNAMEKRCVVDR
jgi:hypothetical protein